MARRLAALGASLVPHHYGPARPRPAPGGDPGGPQAVIAAWITGQVINTEGGFRR